jgi:hypothetical protein
MIDNPEEQLQRVVNRLRKVVEDYSAQVIYEKNEFNLLNQSDTYE